MLLISDLEQLLTARSELRFANSGWPPDLRAGSLGPPQHLSIQHRAIDLIGRDSRKVTAADLTAVGQSAGPLIKKPEAHPLLHQVRFIQMLRQAQDSAQKVSADFDGRFANAPAERRAFLQDQDFQIRLVAEQKERGCRSRQSAADDGDIVGFSLHQSTRLMCKSLLSTLPSLAEIQTSPISASRVASRNLAAQSFAFHTGSPGPLWPSTPSPTRSSLS